MPAFFPLFNVGDDGSFFFESEHLALKGNKDYCEVLKTLVILSSRREKLIKDYIKVIEIRKNVLEDSEVIQKLFNGEDLGIELPVLIDLPKIPVINFEKYNVKLLQTELSDIYSDMYHNGFEEDRKKEQQIEKNDSHQVWTTEEQKKLEELLRKYPPEPIERRRFQKIANELGNRSVSQVASRIQKYFLKLYKAGLPIPGRIPKSLERNKKSFMHKHQRYNYYLWKPTTFFPEFSPPVTMNDFVANDPGPRVQEQFAQPSSASNYLLQTNYHQFTEITGKSKAELQVQLLKRIREEKLKKQENCLEFQHIGYKCDYCSSEPIIGTRWHCTVCPDSVDFCTDCLISQMYTTNIHPITHPMVICEDDKHSNSNEIDFYSNLIANMTEEDDSNDSYGFEEMEKEETEELIGSDEECRSNFDGDAY